MLARKLIDAYNRTSIVCMYKVGTKIIDLGATCCLLKANNKETRTRSSDDNWYQDSDKTPERRWGFC